MVRIPRRVLYNSQHDTTECDKTKHPIEPGAQGGMVRPAHRPCPVRGLPGGPGAPAGERSRHQAGAGQRRGPVRTRAHGRPPRPVHHARQGVLLHAALFDSADARVQLGRRPALMGRHGRRRAPRPVFRGGRVGFGRRGAQRGPAAGRGGASIPPGRARELTRARRRGRCVRTGDRAHPARRARRPPEGGLP